MGTTVDKLRKVLETKAGIKAAIIEKGQSITDSDTFASYVDKIRAITSGREPVLQNKTVTPTGKEIVVTADNTVLYNNIALPDIDSVWADKITYPYAVIRINNSEYGLLLMKNTAYSNSDGIGMFSGEGYAYYSLGDNEWGYGGVSTGTVTINGYNDTTVLIWSSTDIKDGNDIVHFAASEPIKYDGLSSVIVEGDTNLVPENIAKDVTIYGVAGTLEGEGGPGLALPEEYQTYLDEAKSLYSGEYERFFISENEEYITVGFLTSDFTVTGYDEAEGDFGAYGWVSYKYTKSTGNWEETDYMHAESPGYNYSRNIKYADCYIEYNGMTLFPVGMKAYPAVTSINYSNFDNGSFSETLETGNTIEYAVEFNTDGQPNKVTAPDGTVTWIEWSES